MSECESEPNLCGYLHRPEVEVGTSEKIIFEHKRGTESCLVESSSNSIRVSIRMKHEDADPIQYIIGKKFIDFLTRRVEDYVIMRKISIDGYSISFLITNTHIQKSSKENILHFILYFMTEIDKEISAMKIAMNSRSRKIASLFFDAF